MWMLVLIVILAKMVEHVYQQTKDLSVTVPGLISKVSSAKKVGTYILGSKDDATFSFFHAIFKVP